MTVFFVWFVICAVQVNVAKGNVMAACETASAEVGGRKCCVPKRGENSHKTTLEHHKSSDPN